MAWSTAYLASLRNQTQTSGIHTGFSIAYLDFEVKLLEEVRVVAVNKNAVLILRSMDGKSGLVKKWT